LFGGSGLWLLLSSTILLLMAFTALSMITDMRGHFTINMSDGMFREGFSLSESITFDSPTMRLFAEPAVDVPAVSIIDIKDDVNMVDGRHNDVNYFAYTFYIRNDGESTVDYSWQLRFNDETQELSEAMWVMVFEDDQMRFFAQQGKVLSGALWAGKVCTTGLFVSLILLVLFPELPMGTVLFLTWVDTGFLLFSFCSYLLAYFGNRNCLTDWNQS
jgi:hypothetical protein